MQGGRRHGGSWRKTAGEELVRLTRSQEGREGVLALCTGTGRTGRLSLWLVDTSREEVPEGVWIQDMLVAGGHAMFHPVDERCREVVLRPRLGALVSEALRLGARMEVGGLEERRELWGKVEAVSVMIGNLEAMVTGSVSIQKERERGLRVEKRTVTRGSTGEEMTVHVVNCSRQVWVAAREVSSLVTEWRGWDLLEGRLLARGLQPECWRLQEGQEGWAELEARGLATSGQGELLLYRVEALVPALAEICQEVADILARVTTCVKAY